MKKINFSASEISEIINKYKSGISTEKICIYYNVSAVVICRVLKENDIKLSGNKKIINEEEVIKLYNGNTYTISQICTYFSVSKHKIRTILKNNGINSKSSKKYNYYDSIFENIDSEEKSYWLGFLYADGYVRIREKCGSELRLKLAILDENHLLKFKRFISPDNIPVIYEEYKSSKCFKVSINSKKIVNDLINKGCINKKSKIIEFPKFLEPKLISHFIRGYFDGDGSISFSDKQIGLNFVSGSKNFLKEISNKLETEAKCKNANLVGTSENFKYIQFSAKDDLYKIHDYLYRNATIYMERKNEKYNYIINNYNQLKDKINKCRTKI